jgi:hyperosmotically inducible periplasmic protein
LRFDLVVWSVRRRRNGTSSRLGAVLIALVVVAGCSGSGNRPVEEAVTDATIVSAVRARLASDEELAPYGIGVTASGGVVTLTGRVEREAQRDRAGRLAEEVEGIESVRNLIRVGGRGPSAPRSNV